MPTVSRFHPQFSFDLAASTRYYDKISVRLGDPFRNSVKRTLTSIRQRPESFGFVAKPLRAAMVSSFPYVVLYRIDDEVIFFAGLFHAATDPRRWTER